MVIRYLNSRILKLSELNLHRDNLALLNWFLSLETGLMLTSGPTGSGKTTTQYACLDELATPDSKIITIEEPVEKHFEQAVQININQKAGKTWEEGFADWYKLIAEKYVGEWHLVTVEQIIPVYAPSSDSNNEGQYIRTIKIAIERWRNGYVDV